MSDFRKELEQLINRNSKENGSNTPDFILAEFLSDSLAAFDKATVLRSGWYGPKGDFGGPGGSSLVAPGYLDIPIATTASIAVH